MLGQSWMIRVVLCLLVVGAGCGLWAAQMQSAPAPAAPAAPVGETVHGVLTAKGEGWLDIRPEGQKLSLRYTLFQPGTRIDGKIQAFFDGLAPGTELEIIWQPRGTFRMISKLSVVAAAGGASGLVTGTVTDVSTKGMAYLEVRDDQGRTDRYWPAYRGGPGYGPLGGFDKEMCHAFTERHVGDRVEIRKSVDDHIRVVTMRLLALAPGAAPPGGEGGAVTGAVAEKGKDWVVINAEDGTKERYMPQRVIGAADELDKNVLAAIAGLRIGQRVEAHWFRDGERRLYVLKALAGRAAVAPKAAPAKTAPAPNAPAPAMA